MDNEILNYFDSFVNSKDYGLLLKNYDKDYAYDDTTTQDPEYIHLVKFYNKLLNIKDESNYRIEVDSCCSALIEKLFQRYVTKDTFVLTTEQEHPSVKYCLPENNTYIIYVKELYYKNAVSQIIKRFKQSSCTNFFMIMAGTMPGSAEFINPSFFRKLKKALVQEHISHILVLDDCQGLFMLERDFSDFDCILATAHVLVRHGFEMGLLFTRLPQKIGYINKTGLKDFVTKLNYVFNHKKEALQFNKMMSKFFAQEIDGKTFSVDKKQVPHMFVIKTKNMKFSQKHADQLKKFGIILSEINSKIRLIKLRYQETVLFEPKVYADVLVKIRKILHVLRRMKELNDNLNFDNSIDLKYDFTITGTKVRIDEIDKKTYKSLYDPVNSIDECNEYRNITFNYIFKQHQR